MCYGSHRGVSDFSIQIVLNPQKIQYLVNYLTEKLRKHYPQPGAGCSDDSVNKRFEGELCSLFEDYVYRDGSGYFLMNKAGKLVVYNGLGYEEADTNSVMHSVVKSVMLKLGIGVVYTTNSVKKIAEECMVQMSANHKYRFVPDRKYIVFNNCVLKLGMQQGEKDVMLEHSTEYKTDIVLDFDFEPEATNNLWENFYVTTIPNSDHRKAFQEYCGALLADRNYYKIEYTCFVLGPGGNGKSVLVQAVSNVFGKSLISHFSPHQLFKSSQAMYHLAAVDGKLANICTDITAESFANGDFKSFVSGEPLSARHPYGRQTFEVTAPYMLCCANEMPSSVDDTEGYHRRILPIESAQHTYTEEEKDTTLTTKLSSIECRQAIFNWCYEGFRLLRAAGGKIELGEAVKATQKAIKDDNNSARRWLRDSKYRKADKAKVEQTATDPKWVSFKDLYYEYCTYCREYNDGVPQKPRQIGRLLKSIGFHEWRRSTGMYYYVEKDNSMGVGAPSIEIDDTNLPF